MYKKLIELIEAKGSRNKAQVIRDNSDDDDFKNLLYYSLNPLLSYKVSERTLREPEEISTELFFFSNIFECCDYLSRLRATDRATVSQVKALLNTYEDEERELYIKLLSKTLRLGVTASSVNKIIPNLIPEWEVQQSYSFSKYPIKENTEFWLTEKLNGVRATLYNGNLYSRNGTVYTGLNHIINALDFAFKNNLVLDGELVLRDKTGLTDNVSFRIATGIINSDAEEKPEIWFRIFDAVPLKDFESENPTTLYRERRRVMSLVQDNIMRRGVSDVAEVIPVLYHGVDQRMIDVLLDKMVKEDKEGLVLNLNCPYQRKRHKGILKIKRFYTMDLPIIGCEEGSGKLEGTLGSFIVDYKGNPLNVGSGLSDEQRKKFWEVRDELVGNCFIEVKYKEISSNKKTGVESLQFPVFVQLRQDKTEASYE